MINPRTVAYSPHRLLAIRKEFSRPLHKIEDTELPLPDVSSGLLRVTQTSNQDSGCATVAEQGMLSTKSKLGEKLSFVTCSQKVDAKATPNVLYRYLPYIIGGVIVTFAIYCYLQFQKAKKEEKTKSTLL